MTGFTARDLRAIADLTESLLDAPFKQVHNRLHVDVNIGVEDGAQVRITFLPDTEPLVFFAWEAK